jgi:AraC family transcriptional regulator
VQAVVHNGLDGAGERRLAGFAEEPAWNRVGQGWRQIFGNFQTHGLSFEWHDFELKEDLDWARSFHPRSVELCLNILGEGAVQLGPTDHTVKPNGAIFYCNATDSLRAVRSGGQRHQFVTIEFSFDFLREHLSRFAGAMHETIEPIVGEQESVDGVGTPTRLGTRQQHLLQTLREPPILAVAQPLWYQTKALELAAEFFFRNPDGEEFFCHRQQRIAVERVERVMAMLRRDLGNPPSLEDIGRAVGCSPFHLSRTFSGQTGKSIPQFIRELRMERAAELLRSGKHNVTEVALEVGYSPSHFSTVFYQTFGCCAGLYPLKPMQLAKNGTKKLTSK